MIYTLKENSVRQGDDNDGEGLDYFRRVMREGRPFGVDDI